jgi:hypothetical protein
MTMALPTIDNFKHYVDDFNATDHEDVVNIVSNGQSWDWMRQNVPVFSCPEPEIEQLYYYRWWTYRKHIKQTPAGRILTEFITNVRHAAEDNAISCALGHHIAEGRWLRDSALLDEYINFWFTADGGKPHPRFHQYSSWLAAAVVDRCGTTGDRALALRLLDPLVADYDQWEAERRLPNGLFWQYDVRDGMEESITGSRKAKNARPTISSYMFANAAALSRIATWADRPDVAKRFADEAALLKELVQSSLWDEPAQFFKAQKDEGPLSDAREEIGFIPWCFRLPDAGYEKAWAQLRDPKGFDAPFGITTAERRHPLFRSHGVGKCEWDGAVWPFATSQTLDALANVLRYYQQPHVTRQDYLAAIRTYARSQHWDGPPYNGHCYIGEYLDETTGRWLKGDDPRSRYYNHSTYCDLIISGLVGVLPSHEPGQLALHPLLPTGAWEWFWLDRVPYHGKMITVQWDRTGARFGRGAGLSVWCDGRSIARSPELAPLAAPLPTA